MDKQTIIDSVKEMVKAAGFKPSFVSKPADGNIIVRFKDTRSPFSQTAVIITGEEIDRYGDKIEAVVENHVKHVFRELDDRRPLALRAEARRVAEGR